MDTTRVVWVSSVRKLYTYELVTSGLARDIGMSYDVTMKPMDAKPRTEGVVGVKDLVALDEIRAELGLHRPNLAKKAVNAIWRGFNLDKGALDRSPGKWREYRVGLFVCQPTI